MLHALGFHHEQMRPDAEVGFHILCVIRFFNYSENHWKQFMNIHWENIKDGFKSEYKLLRADQWLDQGELYDYNSIMHYLSLEYSKGTYLIISYQWYAKIWSKKFL